MIENKAKILIVDDVESNRFILKDIIEQMGYQPVLAENGNQAYKVVSRIWPQLIILDIAMPEMDGYEFCTLMKSNPKTREIPIIFISAYDNPQDVVKCFELGGEDYITKPFVPEIVKARVGLHLKLYEANRELAESNRLLQTSVNEQLSRIENEKKNVLYALTRIAREYSAYDANHIERISGNCRILSEAMQLSPKYSHEINDIFVDTVEMAAPICDIGNIAVPANILQKNSFLTAEERKEIALHTVKGAKIIDDIIESGEPNDFLRMTFDIVKYHHENWNGSGYPEGLSGNDIPLSAQIVAIVTNYCALTESRAYREPFDRDTALTMLESNVDTKFSRDIVDILKKISKRLK